MRAPRRASSSATPRRCASTTARSGTPVVAIDGGARAEAVEAELAAARARAGGVVILRKSRRELERMAAAGSIVARTLALLRERARPGVDDRRARPRRRGVHPRPRAASRRSRATTASRPRSAPRRTTWSCTASPAPTCCKRGRRALRRRGRDAARLGGRLGLHVLGRRGRAAGRRRAPPGGLPRLALRGGRAVRRRPPPLGCEPRRADARRGATASASSARSSGTGWGGACTRIRRSRTTALPGAGTCCGRA